MNLKYFHLFFIAVSVILAAFVAAWGMNNGSIVATCLSVVGAVALIAYGTMFQRKMRRL
jgi:uncharacterized membrane protein YdjX (TVP38/TMEM64 family)